MHAHMNDMGGHISVEHLAYHYVCNTNTAGERIERHILGEFGMAAYSLQPLHAHCTVAVHVHCMPYFIFNNPQKHPPIPFSRKLRATKQNEKGILVNSFTKTQCFAGLSLLLVYAANISA